MKVCILALSLSFVPFDPDLFPVQPIDGGERGMELFCTHEYVLEINVKCS